MKSYNCHMGKPIIPYSAINHWHLGILSSNQERFSKLQTSRLQEMQPLIKELYRNDGITRGWQFL